MELADRISEMVRPTVEGSGYLLVRVQVLGRQRPRVQVMAEKIDGRPMTVDDCAFLKSFVIRRSGCRGSDRHELYAGGELPGLDRPLVKLADYDRFAGFEARIELVRLVGGRRRFCGRLSGTAGETIRLEVDGAEVEVHYADIRRAKLVLTQDLLATHG